MTSSELLSSRVLDTFQQSPPSAKPVAILTGPQCWLAQVLEWIKRLSRSHTLDYDLILKFTTPAQRGLGTPTEIAQFQAIVAEFQHCTTAAFGVLAPCGIACHPQPCYCPFQAFVHQRYLRVRLLRSPRVQQQRLCI